MNIEKVNSYIGFAVRAGDVVFGLDNIMTARRAVHVIVKDSTLGEASLRKLTNYLEHHAIHLVTLEDELLGRDVLRRDKCKIVGILNESLARAIIGEAESQ